MSADVFDVVALVYRADWMQLSVSATISDTFDPNVARRLTERKSKCVGGKAGSRCESDEPDTWTEPRQAPVITQVNK